MSGTRLQRPLTDAAPGRVVVGVGGWNFAPWRGRFYPAGLPQARELEHASRRLTAIEVNSTFYRAPPAGTYERWRDATLPGFVFTLKAPRFIGQSRDAARAADAAARFVEGALALRDRLGAFLWQLSPTRRFEPDALDRFLAGLPRRAGRRRLRHALEVRHASFAEPALVALARAHGVALVFNDAADYPSIADPCADFIYARLRRSRPTCRAGYPPKALDAWATRVATWAAGGIPPDLPMLAPPPPPAASRDVFVFFIGGAKERNPPAAEALIARSRTRSPAYGMR